MIETLLSLGALAGLLLGGFGIWALFTGYGNRLKAGLMVGAGVVVLINVWLYATPLPTVPGSAPASPDQVPPVLAGTSGPP